MVGIAKLLGRDASRSPQQTDPSAPSQVPHLTVLKQSQTKVAAAPKADEPPDAVVERSRSEQTIIGADGRPITCIKEKVRLWLGRKWQETLSWLLIGTVVAFVLLKGREILQFFKTVLGAVRTVLEQGQLLF